MYPSGVAKLIYVSAQEIERGKKGAEAAEIRRGLVDFFFIKLFFFLLHLCSTRRKKQYLRRCVCVLMCVVGTKEGLARGKLLYFVAVVRVVVVVDLL